ncbi:hypothetical protein AC579_6812 [Pseudocercospora musae]|uniref:Uncharacterized protein n=1 Tax=Pseudocercospora musae TaxID=113226 RepID=A0A139IQ48_9PEZI|nr:hypothetical protein AC579_6812 [Pseudocercospora musae]
MRWFLNYRDGRLKCMKIQRAEALRDRTALLLDTIAALLPRAGTPWHHDLRATALWIPGSVIVLLLVDECRIENASYVATDIAQLFWPVRFDGKVRNNGNYDPGLSTSSTNPKENALVDTEDLKDDEMLMVMVMGTSNSLIIRLTPRSMASTTVGTSGQLQGKVPSFRLRRSETTQH